MTTLIIAIFILGYIGIATEHFIKINKAAMALITGVLCWTVYILFSPDKHLVSEELTHHLVNFQAFCLIVYKSAGNNLFKIIQIDEKQGFTKE